MGGINTLFSLGVYLLLVFLGMHYFFAVLTGTILGILFNFKTYGTLVFKTSDNKLIIKFFSIYALTFIIGIGSLNLMFFLGFTKYTAALVLTVPNALLGFILNKRFVFDRKKAMDKQ